MYTFQAAAQACKRQSIKSGLLASQQGSSHLQALHQLRAPHPWQQSRPSVQSPSGVARQSILPKYGASRN